MGKIWKSQLIKNQFYKASEKYVETTKNIKILN